MTITKEDINYVAKLARLEFKESEEDVLINDLNKMLEYVNSLNELNVEDEEVVINPYYMENKFREDNVEKSLETDAVIKNFPEHIKDYIIVPKIM
ncbi:Asp-tRNA(Asn)/Glu-tRNA(Gln) amidotransferase subunit GatC [Clostridium tyrobutyricum]|uniref:Asp-tRNA(Asn)/Glu-tRNA(Gln) amidotransferase subunit GatC n=1 Tax=Clostridium tyrobutyricum TaxID=1519 RepID=UPI001C382709|nr:Asp-tRNA(Asn)/Glu-tRNA(Gln) amidotransferase subunit GatC [Clostridium tyrobutyricum]MBV4414607.1 Asp-tRNA(Asn)/Glu-tRNA(Gln) amidotransferase subunit GatC [Clostridium tyrobutyricum]MBV4423577.1 Asp-tRNA(Asn)/Glu-tRNA(Gln) amidotransferase subunit GatC [Clostridium tyrobutyricum]